MGQVIYQIIGTLHPEGVRGPPLPAVLLPVRRKDSGHAMFAPDYRNTTCPRCHNVEIYFDCEAGFYGMLCGQQFSTEEIQALVKTQAFRTSRRFGSASG